MAQLKDTKIEGILEIQGKDANGKSLILPEGSKIYIGESHFQGGEELFTKENISNMGFIANDVVAGTQLGLVKNGGNVVINPDGTMTAPENAGGDANVQSDWNESIQTSDAFIKNKPLIKNGNGKKSIVIGDGEATGDYSVAGGTNDKDLVSNLTGSGLLAGLANVETSKAQGAMSLAFGAGNKALTAGTGVLGVNSSAGCKGFYFWSIDFNTKKLTLSTNQKPIILGSRKWTDEAKTQLGNWAVDDVISIVNDSKYVLCSKITAIDANVGTITVDDLPFIEVQSKTLPNFDDYAVTCPSKPTVGVVEQGLGAFTMGLENKATGSFSHVEGWNNLGAGDFSQDEGSKNKAGYCSHAEGRDNEASGQISHAEGSYTVASGTSSHAEGSYTESSGDNSHAEGWGTEARGNQAHSEGAKTRAVGARCHTEGHYSIALGTDAHAEGWSTTLLEDIPIDLSIATNEEIIAQWESTKFNLAKGLRSHVEGANCLALEKYAHAEGSCTIASANQAHSEGNTTKASGSAAHSEGTNTKAIGNHSHAEGYQTSAIGEASHVQGRYNVEDTKNKYAHLVGGGTSDTNRRNIHTLDWDGNAVYTGAVTATDFVTPDGKSLMSLLGDIEAYLASI